KLRTARKKSRHPAHLTQMFDVGFAELFLLALIGLLVLGPERLPKVARTVGGFVRKARTSWISLRNTIQAELNEADISAPIKQAEKELKQIGKNLSDLTDTISEKTSPSAAKPDTETDKTQQKAPAARDDDV
ncbi:MAG: Sec-independent protein translocase protein TatB, partial [Xanthomonadales bacterium]|nr:Sec-independent protein translocase protein TatB [Xanthomonadales bacterium]